MTPEPLAANTTTPAPTTTPEAALTWLASQATPDHGESAPPLPADLLSDIQKKFGLAPEAARSVERVSLWSRLSALSWGGALATACVVALLAFHFTTPMAGPGNGAEPMRGQSTVVGTPGISWHWIGLEAFPAEAATVAKEDLTEEISSSAIVVTLDATRDPLAVIVTVTKNGKVQPSLERKLPKQATPARANEWVTTLQELQSQLSATP